MNDLKYSEILKRNKALGESFQGPGYQITILSNIITSQLNDILEYSLRSEKINTKASAGDYDNILQDSLKYKESDLIIIFWELANLIDGLQYKANLMNEDELGALVNKLKSEIDFVLLNLKDSSLIMINKFSSLIFNHERIRENNFDRIAKELNAYLEKKAESNLLIIDIDKILSKLSISKSVDFRYYYSSKALYSIDFYKAYAQFIKPIILSIKGKAKKALILDCDNTLWKGILGEDGFDGIQMSGETKGGVVFQEVQSLALELHKQGILIGLCSKNNPEEVENVLTSHRDMALKNDHIIIKKVNWEDKVSNLKEIAKQLNIGLESLTFVDDSDFEIGLVTGHLQEVSTLKVPSNLYEYPAMMREHQLLFYNISSTTEDLKRTELYRQQQERETLKQSFSDIHHYLDSLELGVDIQMNEKSAIPRIAQMTQKTNQFNLTTNRYTEKEIEQFMANGRHVIFSFSVTDKYGDYGLTGMAVVEIAGKEAFVDSLLMSCRVIGRNVELAFVDFLINYLKEREITCVRATYSKTLKNEQVADFYDKLGWLTVENAEGIKKYELKLKDYIFQNINYIKVKHGREN